MRKDALFLIASITKPVTATAIMMLLERGRLALDDRVADYVPAFAANGKRDVLIRHLMTHTSGLPDMLPENEKLRRAHRPLSAFVEGTCRLPLLFPPGTRVNYQSMGIAMLAEIVHQVTGVALSEFLAKEVFGPLEMADTSLGVQGRGGAHGRRARAGGAGERRLELEQRVLARPRGAVGRPGDQPKRLRQFLPDDAARRHPGKNTYPEPGIGAGHDDEPTGRYAARAGGGSPLQAVGPRLASQLARAFGQLRRPDRPASMATGGPRDTLCWIDPDAEAFFILFTTQPQEPEGRFLCACRTSSRRDWFQRT